MKAEKKSTQQPGYKQSNYRHTIHIQKEKQGESATHNFSLSPCAPRRTDDDETSLLDERALRLAPFGAMIAALLADTHEAQALLDAALAARVGYVAASALAGCPLLLRPPVSVVGAVERWQCLER
jgi:hypothetical protein